MSERLGVGLGLEHIELTPEQEAFSGFVAEHLEGVEPDVKGEAFKVSNAERSFVVSDPKVRLFADHIELQRVERAWDGEMADTGSVSYMVFFTHEDMRRARLAIMLTARENGLVQESVMNEGAWQPADEGLLTRANMVLKTLETDGLMYPLH